MPAARRHVLPGLALTAVLVLGAAACGSGSSDSSSTTAVNGPSGSAATGGSATTTELTIEVSERGCSPSSVEMKAGTIRLTAKNVGEGIGELEVITAGKKVKGEAENIGPGMSSSFSADVETGNYELICYSDEAPRGTLIAR